VPEVAAERFASRALHVQVQRLCFTWDGVSRGSKGHRDYAVVYVAKHMPDLDLADVRDEILARHLDADGQVVADYLLITGRCAPTGPAAHSGGSEAVSIWVESTNCRFQSAGDTALDERIRGRK
jgi:hypothetical protein